MKKIILFLVLSFAFGGVYSQAGSLDPSFAGKGWTNTEFIKGNFYDETNGYTLLQKSGNYIMAFEVNGSTLLARYVPGGNQVKIFGTAGYSDPVQITNPTAALQSNGKIVVAGRTYNSNTGEYNFAVARYTENGKLDNTFSGDGILSTDFFGGFSVIYSLAIQANGKIVAAGQAYDPDLQRSVFAVARYNTNGSLDNTFDGDGKQTANFGSDAQAYGVAIQSDGKIVVAGEVFNSIISNRDFGLVRYNTDGSPDNTFDGDGLVTTDFFGSDDFPFSMAIQSDGKIVVGGQTDNPNTQSYDFGIARYNTDGSLDDTFNGDGKTTADFFGSSDVAASLAIQTDNKIVAAGSGYNTDGNDFAVARFNTDGSLDNTFGSQGKQTTDFGNVDDAFSVFVQSDGKIVVGGQTYNPTSNIDFAMARYNSDGSLDIGFSGDGRQTGYYAAGQTNINAIAVQPDGKIVVAGKTLTLNRGYDFAVARYNSDGSLDNTFDGDGKQTTSFSGNDDIASAVTIQSDGKIVVAGSAFTAPDAANFALARYNSNGSLDKTFSGDGKQTTDFSIQDYASAVAIQTDGKIVVAGRTFGSSADFALARYNTNGSLDRSFDGDGKQTTDFFGFDDYANSIALQTDGKIVVGGFAIDANGSDFALARYNTNGTIDANFGVNGKVATDFANSDEGGSSVAIQGDGKIIIAGETVSSETGAADFALARYNTDGTLDSPGFAGDGMVTTDFGWRDYVNSIALQSDGKIVAIGDTEGSRSEVFVLARYNTDGSLDNSFDGDGKQISDFPGHENFALALAIANNRIYVAGYSDPYIKIGIVAAYQTGAITMASPVIADASAVKDQPNEQTLMQKFAAKVFPNPTTNYFTLQFNAENTNSVNIKVFDVQGKLIETRTNVAINSSVQLGYNYRPGVYFAEIIQGNKKAVVKLVKQ